jgi:hypothetical protein
MEIKVMFQTTKQMLLDESSQFQRTHLSNLSTGPVNSGGFSATSFSASDLQIWGWGKTLSPCSSHQYSW